MQLAFREYGSGQPLIILHGLFGQSDNWNTMAKRFEEKGFRVFTVDQRNHGLSAHSEIWDYKVMADDLKNFISQHQLEKPIVLGHSMGGKTAMFFELYFPGIAEKLIIADIAPRAYEAKHDSVLKALKAVDFSKIKNRKEAEAVLNEHIPDFGTKQFLLKNIYWKDADSGLMNWRFNLKVIDKEYANIGVEVPDSKSNIETLFIRGEKSNYISEKDLTDIEKRFPNYKLVTIKDSGHWIHAEKPNEFFEEVLKFIKV